MRFRGRRTGDEALDRTSATVRVSYGCFLLWANGAIREYIFPEFSKSVMLTVSRVEVDEVDEVVDEAGVAAAGNAHSEQTTMIFPKRTACSKNTITSSTWFPTRTARAFGMRCAANYPILSASQARKGKSHASMVHGRPLLMIVPGMPFLSGKNS